MGIFLTLPKTGNRNIEKWGEPSRDVSGFGHIKNRFNVKTEIN